MSVETDHPTTPVAPAGEEIHMPGPSILPFVSAIAITLIVIGTTIDWIFSAIGGVILVVTTIQWIKDTRRDIAALPDQHH